jgi:hypothetical protein
MDIGDATPPDPGDAVWMIPNSRFAQSGGIWQGTGGAGLIRFEMAGMTPADRDSHAQAAIEAPQAQLNPEANTLGVSDCSFP